MTMDITDKIIAAKAAIYRQIEKGHPLVIGWSGGKDSTCVAQLALLAAKDAVKAGIDPMIVISSGNTLVDNPEVVRHVETDIVKMAEYGKRWGFDVTTQIVAPALSSTWQVKVITGRGLPSYVGMQSDCTVDMKIDPQALFRKKHFAQMSAAAAEPVICLGTRFEESAARAKNMKSRNESATEPVRNKDQELILSPIAEWDGDEVWEAISAFEVNKQERFSDFKELRRIYSNSEGTDCVAIADLVGVKREGGCGARTGCYVCLKAEDRSLENMVMHDERYEYAKGLLKLNKFLRNTYHDLERRNWVGRTVKEEHLVFGPDTYHPTMQREIFRFMVQLDHDEERRVAEINRVALNAYVIDRVTREDAKEPELAAPMFQILSAEMIVAIDALWSLNGHQEPFAAWADYAAITHGEVRYDIPEVPLVAQQAIPVPKFIHIGDINLEDGPFSGLRDGYYEALAEGSFCAPELKELDSGRSIWELDTVESFNVNPESAELIKQFELKSILEKHARGFAPGGVTSAYKFYAQYGALELSSGQLASHDKILRRTELKDKLGLTQHYSIKDVGGLAVRFDQMPENAQEAWRDRMKIDRVSELQMSLFDSMGEVSPLASILALKDGNYVGKVLDVKDGVVLQRVSREGDVVGHAMPSLSENVYSGQVIDIYYRNGRGLVKDNGRMLEKVIGQNR